MQTPQFVDGQFVDGTLLNGAIAMLMNDFEFIGSELHTPGLLNPGSMVITPSALQVTINLPSTGTAPFAVLFKNGALVNANGLASGAVTTTYAVDLTSLVPTSGNPVTIYLLASYGQIGEQQTQVIGPPEGHPDYDPTFAPFNFYMEGLDTLVITAGLTAADNQTTFELCRLPLAVGQTTINQSSIVTSNWKYASAVLNPTGVTAGTYTGATVQVGADGRLTGVSSVAYGPLAGNNTWTGMNIFDDPVTATDTGTGGLVITGGGSGANIVLQGGGTVTPNKYLRAMNGLFEIMNSGYTAAPLTLTDAGVLTILGELFSQGVNAGGGEIQTTGLLSGNTLGVGTSANIGTSLQVGSTITANGSITTHGNLIASVGAYGTGNGSLGVILSDFHGGWQNGWVILPDELMIQWGGGSWVGESGGVLSKPFTTSFRNQCLSMALTVGYQNGSTFMGAQPVSAGAYYVSAYAVTGGYLPGEGYSWIAIGY
jgi:hypothetical protein